MAEWCLRGLSPNFAPDPRVNKVPKGKRNISGKNKKQSHRDSKRRESIYLILGTIVLGLLSLGLLFKASGNATLVYDFDTNSKIKKWNIYNTSFEKITTGNIRFNKINKTAVLFNSQKNLQSLKWQNTPYIKLIVKPENLPRKISLIWSPTKDIKDINENYQRPIDIPENQTSIIINVAQNIPWIRSFSWKDSVYGNTQINSFGFFIPQQYEGFEINRVELLPSLNIFEYVKLIMRELSVVEPVKVSSINAQYGISILGTQVAYFLGVILIILAVPLLISFNKSNTYIFIIAMAISFALYDVTANQTLLNAAKYASDRSAWQTDKHQEYQSRFGDQFAKLAQEFENKVPHGAKVHFSVSRDYRVQGESNWIAFQYFGLYKISTIKDADYIFYYYPKKLQFDSSEQIVKNDKAQYNAQAIISINNNYILRKN